MHHQRVEIISRTASCVIARVLQFGDQHLQAELVVLDAGRLGQRPPVGDPEPVVL
jgi:hypothetical protein